MKIEVRLQLNWQPSETLTGLVRKKYQNLNEVCRVLVECLEAIS
jgi:hypothetical protein